MTESASLSGANDPSFSAPVREGEIVAGKYVVGRLLGLGGMGAVFEARDAGLERRVALKVLLPRLVTSSTAAQRFVNEARAATRITSEHVVKLLEIGSLPDGTPLLVMEYLEGKDLRALLRESGPLEPQVAVDYLLQALQAIAEGHMHGIVHRDLKPGNLFLLERADGTPLIKVLDFGIAKTLASGRPGDFALTSSEDVQLGSPTYMPPEQFRNPRDVDARADIWALGVTLYELISGRVPFQGLTYPELVSQVLSGAPDSLKSTLVGVSLPPGLADIVWKCLEKDRDRRYLNAVELAIALAPFGSDDARLSLTRVSGLSRPRTPTPNPGSPRPPSDTYEATLPVAVDATERRSLGASGSRRVLQSPRSRRSTALGALALAAIVGSLIWRQGGPPQPHSAPPPRTLSAGLSALQTASAPPSAHIAVLPVPSTAVESKPIEAAIAIQTPAAPKRARASAPPHQNGAVGPSAPSAEVATAQPTSDVTAATTVSNPAPSELGPSSRIESLIEQRH